MRFKKITLSILALSVIIVTGWAGFHFSGPMSHQPPPEISGTLLPTPKPLKPFQLTDHRGQSFRIEHLKGHWSFLFFGYTHCPDVCPTTLLTFKAIHSKLKEMPGTIDDIQFILVSLDPERDSVEYLKQYIQNVHPDFIALTGKTEQIKQFADQSWIYYLRDKSNSDGSNGDSSDKSSINNYLIDHSATIVLLNPNGEIHAIFAAPHHAEKIINDFINIREMNIRKHL